MKTRLFKLITDHIFECNGVSDNTYARTDMIGLSFFKNKSDEMTAILTGGFHEKPEECLGEDKILNQLSALNISIKYVDLDSKWASYILKNMNKIHIAAQSKIITLKKYFKQIEKTNLANAYLPLLIYVAANQDITYLFRNKYRITFNITGYDTAALLCYKHQNEPFTIVNRKDFQNDYDFMSDIKRAIFEEQNRPW